MVYKYFVFAVKANCASCGTCINSSTKSTPPCLSIPGSATGIDILLITLSLSDIAVHIRQIKRRSGEYFFVSGPSN